jgi:molybdate transport system substrate-binding protein
MIRWLVLVLALGVAPVARADELVVFSAAAVKAALADVPQRFAAETGTQLRLVFGTAGATHDRAASGGAFDLVILPTAPLADLVRRGVVADASRHDLGTVRLGAAVRAGSPQPRIGTEAEFTQALLAAPSIGVADPATGATTGVFLASLLKRLGLAETLRPKLHRYADGLTAMEAEARGEVALGLGQISEILPVAGVTLVGPLPESVQLRSVYAAGLSAHAQPQAAALMRLLTGHDMVDVFRRNGFDMASD